MESYPNNSNAYRAANNMPSVIPASGVEPIKEETPKPQEEQAPQTPTAVRKKKKTFGSKLRDLFVKEDAKTVSQYIFGDILIPAFTNTVLDIIKNGAEMMFLGRTSGRGYGRGGYGNGGRIRYENYYDGDPDYLGRRSQYSARPVSVPTQSYDELIFESRADADEVLIDMKRRVMESGYVSIAYLYNHPRVRWHSDYTADGWGWKDLRSASVVMCQGGWWLKLPRPVVV